MMGYGVRYGVWVWVWKWEVGEDSAGAADHHTYVPTLGLGLEMQRMTQTVIRRCFWISRTELPHMSLRGRTQSR